MKKVPITFKNLEDFRSRIAKLWQDQKDDELYEFEFPDEETIKEFEDLVKRFNDES